MMLLDLDKNKPAMTLDLTKEVPQLKKLKGVLSWDPHPAYPADLAKGIDLDIFIYCLNYSQKVEAQGDIIYFKNKGTGGPISVPVDNRTGEGDSEDDEFFLADLENLPTNRYQFDVYVFIHDAANRGQTFGMISGAKFRLFDEVLNEELVRYSINQKFANETALHVGSIIRGDDGHITFQPQGVAGAMNPNEVLQHYV